MLAAQGCSQAVPPVKPESPPLVFAEQWQRAQLFQFSLMHCPLLPPTFVTTSFSYKYVNSLHYTGQNITFFTSVLWPKKCQNTFLAPSSRTGRGHPSPDPTPLSAFGASILMLAPNHLWRFNLHAPLAKPGAPPQL